MNRTAAPLHIVAISAVGASGLGAQALAAAVWSSLARFELTAGESMGIGDTLRVSPCPLFDAETPLAERLGDMLRRTHTGIAKSLAPHPSHSLLLVGPNSSERPPLAADWVGRLVVAPTQAWTGAAGAWAQALTAAAALLATAPPGHLCLLGGIDSLLDVQTLKELHGQGALSTEQCTEGLIPSEAAALLALATPATAQALRLPILGSIHGVGEVPITTSPAQALIDAIATARTAAAAAVPPAPVHTLLWDIAAEDAHLEAVAEAIVKLPEHLAGATVVRPFMQLGYIGAAFGPVAAVLALEGSRAGVTRGGSTLIVTLDAASATAVYLTAPARPHIMLHDLPAPPGAP